MTLPHWLVHRWGKWQPYEVPVSQIDDSGKERRAIEKRQRRECLVCGWRQETVIQKGFRYT